MSVAVEWLIIGIGLVAAWSWFIYSLGFDRGRAKEWVKLEAEWKKVGAEYRRIGSEWKKLTDTTRQARFQLLQQVITSRTWNGQHPSC